jgi:hypothetical protein
LEYATSALNGNDWFFNFLASIPLTTSQHNDIVELMIPDFDGDGNLPLGIHWAVWTEVTLRFGLTAHRRRLLSGLKVALDQFSAAGCVSFFLDGSFVTAKDHPGDYDACWDVVGVDPAMLDPVFYDFTDFKKAREAQKRKYFGEFFPAQLPEGLSGKQFVDFFQTDKTTGASKGIVGLDLRRWQP